ncbi:3-isopropylmalate dehydrogenase [Alkaliphilus crotonatoxidans]
MKYKIAVIPGDGIGPEVVEAALGVLNEIGELYQHNFEYQEVMVGGCAYDQEGTPLPEASLTACQNSDAVLLGAVGGERWDTLPGHLRPEAALLGLRKSLGLYANIRPVVLHQTLAAASPLKDSIIQGGVDLCVVRELTGGIYFGERGYKNHQEKGEVAYDTEAYSVKEVERIGRRAFEMALKRNKRVTSVDKANVLESSRLWRKTIVELAKEYPEVTLDHMYVDNGAMQLVRNPKQFDVIVTTNMFGDILSDEASMITGSIGMLPSASLGTGNFGMYEPIHGSAPDIAGQNKANPLATILSTAMMLRLSFNLEAEAAAIEGAVTRVLEKGYRTGDIFSEDNTLVGTREMGELVTAALKE